MKQQAKSKNEKNDIIIFFKIAAPPCLTKYLFNVAKEKLYKCKYKKIA